MVNKLMSSQKKTIDVLKLNIEIIYSYKNI